MRNGGVPRVLRSRQRSQVACTLASAARKDGGHLPEVPIDTFTIQLINRDTPNAFHIDSLTKLLSKGMLQLALSSAI